MEAMKKTLNGIFISTMKKQSLNRGLKIDCPIDYVYAFDII